MLACVSVLFLVAANCVTVNKLEPTEPKTDIKIPLKPLFVSCSLSDVVIITAPVVRDARYFLTRPDGYTISLNITRPSYRSPKHTNTLHDSISIKHENSYKMIEAVLRHKVFDLAPDDYGDTEDFEAQTKDVNSNDFVIGPLMEEDHGNWCLSLYYKDVRGKWIELYQVITLSITEYVPPSPRLSILEPGGTFDFSFAYAIPGLESCELQAPKSTFDRFYSRDLKVDMARCGYSVPNITKQDRGYWGIIGVGRVVYQTQVYLEVKTDVQGVA